MPLDFTHYIETLTFGNEKQMQIMTKKFDENFSSQVHGSSVIQSEHVEKRQISVNYYLEIN